MTEQYPEYLEARGFRPTIGALLRDESEDEDEEQEENNGEEEDDDDDGDQGYSE